MDELLRELYACAEAPDRWRMVLDGLCERMQVRSAVLQVIERRPGRSRCVWQARDSYSHAHRERHDLILNNEQSPRFRAPYAALAAPAGMVIRDEDIFPPGSPERVDLKARLTALGFGDDMRALTDLPDDRGLVLLVHRCAGDHRRLGAEDEALLSGLMPHARQCVQLMTQLSRHRARNELQADLLDMLGVGVLLCDEQGGLLWANSAGQAVLDRSPYLTSSRGQVRAVRPHDRPALAALLQAAAEPDGEPLGAMQLTLGREDPAEVVQLLAVRPGAQADQGDGGDARVIVLLIGEPGRALELPPESLADLLGLSSAEARLAAGLCHGLPLADYARQVGISLATARTQLKRTFAKTGTARQSDLVMRAYASLATRLRPEHTAAIAPPTTWASRSRRLR